MGSQVAVAIFRQPSLPHFSKDIQDVNGLRRVRTFMPLFSYRGLLSSLDQYRILYINCQSY